MKAYTFYNKTWNREVIEVNVTCLSNGKIPGYCDMEVEHEGKTWKLDVTQLWDTRDGAAKELFNIKLGNNESKCALTLIERRSKYHPDYKRAKASQNDDFLKENNYRV